MPDRRRSQDAIDDLVSQLGPGPWPLEAVRRLRWSESQVRAAVSRGRLIRPRRGVLSTPFELMTPTGLASVPAIRSALLVCDRSAVVSHESAGLVHGTWIPSPASSMVQVTQSGGVDRTTRGVRQHESRLRPADVVLVEGIPVTSLSRTAVDMARGRRLPEALVAIDGVARALAIGDEGRDEAAFRDRARRQALRETVRAPLLQSYADVWSWPGSVVVRDAIQLLDLASESPLESRSRGWMLLAQLPRPETAFAVQGGSGRWYFADFAWPDRQVLGEADGTAKYGAHPEQVVARLREERVRQRDIEDAGWRVVRWDSTERAATVIARLRRALAFDGTTSTSPNRR